MDHSLSKIMFPTTLPLVPHNRRPNPVTITPSDHRLLPKTFKTQICKNLNHLKYSNPNVRKISHPKIKTQICNQNKTQFRPPKYST